MLSTIKGWLLEYAEDWKVFVLSYILRLKDWIAPRFDRMLDKSDGQFLFFAGMEFISFFIICSNYRAVAIGSYFWSGLTDFLVLVQNGCLGKLAIDDKRARTWFAVAGTAIGGTCGSLTAIWVTKHILGR